VANKFHNDIGYDQNTECIWLYNNNTTPTISGLNTSNRWYQAGVNFNCISPPNTIKGGSEGLAQVAQPGMGNNGWQKNANPIIDCDGDGVGLCSNNSSGANCNGHMMYGPRVYLISPYLAIASQHYRPHFTQCGEGDDGIEDTIKFWYEEGSYDAKVEAYRLIKNEQSGGGGCYQYNPGACNVPSGVADISSDNEQILLACMPDRVLIKFKEPVPAFIKPTKLVTERFLNKYMNEFENPETAQNNRLLVMVDQYQRPLIRRDAFTFENADQPETADYLVNGSSCPADQQIGVIPDNNYHININTYGAGISTIGGEWLSSSVKDKYSISTVFGNFTTKTRSGGSFFPGMGSYIPSSDYIPNEKSIPVDYDLRDGTSRDSTTEAVWAGDSGSASFIVMNDGTTGFIGLTNTIGGSIDYWGNYGWEAAVKAICDEYEIPHPEMIDEDHDFTEYTTPLSSRPSLGYKIYKSAISETGPFYDITSQIAPQTTSNLMNNDLTGYPCIDPSVPCYTIHENFIDEYVGEENNYWYYITTLNQVDSTVIESQPSDVISVNIPQSCNYSDERQLFISRTSANDGFSSPYQNPDYPTTSEDMGRDILCIGWNMGDNTYSIPLLGFSDNFNSPIKPRLPMSQLPLFYSVEGGNNYNNGIQRKLPLPIDNTSYQYVMGHKYDIGETEGNNKSNNNLYIDYNFEDFEVYQSWKNSVESLNFTRFYREDGENRGKYEPFFHSRIFPGIFINLKTILINPARYGNGRSTWSEDWSYGESGQINGIEESYIGFYMGEYLKNDIAEKNSETLDTLIAKDSSMDTLHQQLEYFNTIGLSLSYLDMSNNNLYRIDFDNSSLSNLTHLNLQNNNICSDASYDGKWLNDASFPNKINSLDLSGAGSLEYLNVKDNPNLELILPPSMNNLLYFDASNTNVGVNNPLIINSSSIRQFILTNTSTEHVTFKNSLNLENISISNTNISKIKTIKGNPTGCSPFSALKYIDAQYSSLTSLNLRYSNSQDWSSRTNPTNEESSYDYNEFGDVSYKLTDINLENSSNLKRLYLPDPSVNDSSCISGEQKLLETIDVRGCKLGVNDSLEFFLSQEAFDPKNYPVGHTLTVNAINNKDSVTGNNVETNLMFIYNLVDSWSYEGKTLILNVDLTTT